MPQWFMTALSTALPSLIVGVLTAIIAVRLSLRRFHAERWWERKADAYSRIVEALHAAMEYWAARSHEDMTGHQVAEEREKRLSEDYDRAAQELNKATGVGAYIVSEEVAVSLARLQKRPRLDSKDYAWFEIYEAEYEAHKKALIEIRQLAKRDLRV